MPCRYLTLGCFEMLPGEAAAAAHAAICKFATVPCPFKCGLMLQRQEIPVHLPACKRLAADMVACEGCGAAVQKAALDAHLELLCPVGKIVPCKHAKVRLSAPGVADIRASAVLSNGP